MAHFLVANDYISGGSRSSSRNGGSPIHMRTLLNSQLNDIYDQTLNPTNQPLSLQFFSASSQKIKQLTQTVIDNHYEQGCPPDSHAYIFGGYCDLTVKKTIPLYRLKNQNVHYEEVVFDHTIPSAYGHLVAEIVKSARILRGEGIRPCFATIPPASLKEWNNFRLSNGKTALLLHEGQYDDMQGRLDTVLSSVNSFICKLNYWNNMYTPYIAGTVLRTKAKRSDNFILQWHKFYDGVHADDTLIEEWATKFSRAIRKNRVAFRSAHQHASASLSIPLTDEWIHSFTS